MSSIPEPLAGDGEYTPGQRKLFASAAVMVETPEWNEVERAFDQDIKNLLGIVLDMNPYDGEPVTCGKGFLEKFYELQREVRACVHAVNLVHNLAQAHSLAQETRDNG